MAQTKVDRLTALGMAPELANEFRQTPGQGAAVTDSAAADVAGVNTVLNSLLASLRASGAIAS